MTAQDLERDFRSLGKAISGSSAGLRLDLYLGQCFPFLSRTRWQQRIQNREVLINGKAVRATYRLKSGDEVCYFLPQESEPQVNRKIAVLWRDAGIMAVEKPSNLPMHEGGRYRLNTFYELLRSEVGEQWAAVHRLDRETSGIVICAGTKDLRNQLSAEFRQRTMKKSYLALVKGVPADDDFTVDAPIGDASQTIFRQKKWVESDGLPAVTRFRVLAKGCYHSLLEAQPLTGRTHQIRVHAAWSGYPLVGDKKYHPDESVYLDYMDNGLTEKVLEAVEGERLCLHAALLSFRRPHSEGIVTVECPMPADMRAISLRLLGSDLLGVLPGK